MAPTGGGPTPDPTSVGTETELRAAVLGLLGDSYDRAVESRTGLSKTTVNDLRNQRRRVTLKTLTMIVDVYDPGRREDWVAAWRRVRDSTPTAAPGAGTAVPGAPGPARPAVDPSGSGAPADPPAAAAATGSGNATADPAVAPDSNARLWDAGAADSPVSDAPAPGARPYPGVDVAAPDPAQDPAGRPAPSWAAAAPGIVPPGRPAADRSVRRVIVRIRQLTGRRRLAVGGIVAAACIVAAGAAVVLPGGSGGPASGAGRNPAGGTSPPGGTTGPAPGYGANSGAGVGRPPGGPVPPPGAPGPVGGPGPQPGPGGPPPPGVVPTVAPGCYSLPLRTRATVVAQPGARVTGRTLEAASYTLYPALNPSLALGGRLNRRPPAGQSLVGAAWADPATRDSTPTHNPGTGRIYPGIELTLSAQNCFTVAPYNISYSGYSGLTTRIYVLLVATSKAPALGFDAAQRSGFTGPELTAEGAAILGYFTVPSNPM